MSSFDDIILEIQDPGEQRLQDFLDALSTGICAAQQSDEQEEEASQLTLENVGGIFALYYAVFFAALALHFMTRWFAPKPVPQLETQPVCCFSMIDAYSLG